MKLKFGWKETNNYDHNSIKPGFAFVENDPKDFFEANNFEECRETLCYEFGTSLAYGRQYRSGPRNFKKFEILVHVRDEIVHGASEMIDNAVKVLNLIERRLGWGRTSARQLKIFPNMRERAAQIGDSRVYYLTGSTKWWKSPHLLSLFLLIIRNGRAFEGVKRIEDFGKNLDETKINTARDKQYLNLVARYLPVLLKNIDSLFFSDLGQKRLFSATSKDLLYDAPNEGIHELLTGRSKVPALKERFKTLCQSVK